MCGTYFSCARALGRYVIIFGCLIWGTLTLLGYDVLRLCVAPWEWELQAAPSAMAAIDGDPNDAAGTFSLGGVGNATTATATPADDSGNGGVDGAAGTCALRINDLFFIFWLGVVTGPAAVWAVVTTCRHPNARGQRCEMFKQLVPVLVVVALSFCWPPQTLAANAHAVTVASGERFLRACVSCVRACVGVCVRCCEAGVR